MMKFFMFMIFLNFLFFINNFLNMFIYFLMMFMLIYMILNFNINNYWMSIYSNLGMDWMSYSLNLLTLLIMMIIFFISKKNKLFIFLLYLLMMMLLLSFSFMNLFMFYMFFEISLIPTFLMIYGWGYQYERINASFFMLIYTLIFSLPLLIFMFSLYNELNNLNYLIMNNLIFINLNKWSILMEMFLIMGFMVKLPLFMIHIWLPKAHVQAPIEGSMILASIMLKLGSYGIYRSMNLMIFNEFLDFFMNLSILGMLFLSMLCLRLMDLKMIVAYSSIVHMMMMLLGMFTESTWGIKGSYLMIMAHGLSSPSMFYLVNLFYERTMSRNIIINKGLSALFPSMMLLWFLICMNNMASPISLNLLSEIFIINVIKNWSIYSILYILISMFFSASYNLYLFSYTYHGKNYKNLLKDHSMKISEYMSIIMMVIPLNLMFLKLNFFF